MFLSFFVIHFLILFIWYFVFTSRTFQLCKCVPCLQVATPIVIQTRSKFSTRRLHPINWPFLCTAQDWVDVVSNCTMGMFLGRYRFFHWLLRGCAANWLEIRRLKTKKYDFKPSGTKKFKDLGPLS